jgi:hypothetical protein
MFYILAQLGLPWKTAWLRHRNTKATERLEAPKHNRVSRLGGRSKG